MTLRRIILPKFLSHAPGLLPPDSLAHVLDFLKIQSFILLHLHVLNVMPAPKSYLDFEGHFCS